jgi:hypothetical protein
VRVLFLNHSPSEAVKRDMGEVWEAALIGPLRESGLADVKEIWTGPWQKKDEQPVDWPIIEECVAFRPDIIFIYGLPCYPDDRHKEGYVSFTGLYLLRKLLDAKVIAVVFDLAYENFHLTDNLVAMCDLAITFEDENLFHGFSRYPEKHIVTLAPHSARLFNGDARTHRDFGVTFVGGTSGYKNIRSNGIAALRANGIEVEAPGGRGKKQQRLSNEEYARLIHRSKIVINWSQHISGRWYHAKGRIFETTLAGSMLLCEECDAVNRWFEPFVDYVPFKTLEELIERAGYYLEHEEERLKIAIEGNKKALAYYDADVVWQQRLREIEHKSMYDEAAALKTLQRNATGNELRVAHYLQCHIGSLSPLHQSLADELLVSIDRAHFSLSQRVQRSIPQLVWLAKKKRKQIRYKFLSALRVVVPNFITKKSIVNAIKMIGLRGNK